MPILSVMKGALRAALYALCLVVIVPPAIASTSQERFEATGSISPGANPPTQLKELLGKSPTELEALFRSNEAGSIPEGNAAGEAIGPFLKRLFARLVHDVAWQGKVFTPGPNGTSTLVNKLGPEGRRDVKADVYYTESWLDGKKCIVLDYRKSTFWARKIRDEIRLIDPADRLYLGVVFWGKTRLIYFALQFPAQPPNPVR